MISTDILLGNMLLNIMFVTSVICLRYVFVIVYALFFVSFCLVWCRLFNNKKKKNTFNSSSGKDNLPKVETPPLLRREDTTNMDRLINLFFEKKKER